MATDPHYETIVYRFRDLDTRKAFFDKFFPGNPFAVSPMDGVDITAMSMSDVISSCDDCEEALRDIAGGHSDPDEIAQAALDKISGKFQKIAKRNAGIATQGELL